MLFSGGSLIALQSLIGRYESAVGAADLFGDAGNGVAGGRSIDGPVTVLLVGIDPRNNDPFWIPRADSVLIVHLPAGLDRAYLFSLPRDLLVEIEPFPKADYEGNSAEKLAHAMFFGSQVPGQERPNIAQGFELLAATVAGYTGISRFDAGAIIDFSGFRQVIDALGGVDMVVDQEVHSIHVQPDGTPRPMGDSPTGYVGPQMVYLPGPHHFVGWQALDYARQRYTDGGDYSRQRHQQQLIKAMIDKAFSSELAANPIALDRVLRAAGQSLTFSGRGYSVLEWAMSLRRVEPDNVITLQLPGESVLAGDEYQGERLFKESTDLFEAIGAGNVDGYVASHPEMVNRSH